MDFFLFFVFSLIEGISIFVLMFSLFRFKIKDYLAFIFFTSSIMAFISYFLRTQLMLDSVTPLVLAVLTIILLRYLFRIHFFYSIIMFSITLISSMVLQGFLIFISQALDIYTLDEIRSNESLLYLTQFVTSLLTFCISWIILKKRIGFTFVPFDENYRENYIKKENVYLIFLVMLCIPLSVMLIDLKNIPLAVAVFVIILIALLNMLYRKEKGTGL